ncbi:MAG: Asp-tRNA(Asn)/Glu-tRNA(Gln) amidotransferase subunit GatB [Truepera sp.]|nr:Asp-tRNA(Asn)/Glu-tRNA(Gln) amidotransferase subunit GatB [Truepera sp.]
MEPVIGLEVHLALNTKSKMFCACRADTFGLAPNSSTCPVCLGLPGSLPTINRKAVEKALRFSLALHCQVPETTQFHRKNYYYPDAPKNYQISQYDRPLGAGGFLELTSGRRIGITRCHLEEDAGRLVHPAYADYSLVDLNRAGAALIELVTEPDLRTPEEAREFLVRVQAIAQAVEVSDANPEEGKMRADVNISLRRPSEPLGTKVEVKNLNSFKSVQRSLEYEIKRQRRLLEGGGRISQDTLGWDEGGQKTFLLRTKEETADYRYFPEPDLPPLQIDSTWLSQVQKAMPELPEAKRQRYGALGVRDYDASIIAYDVALANFFDAAAAQARNPQAIANWLNGDISGWLNAHNLTISATALTPALLTELVALVDDGTISGKTAKELLPEVMQGAAPSRLVEARGLKQVSDSAEISALVEAVIANNSAIVATIKTNPKAVNALLGQVLRESRGKANPELVRALLNSKLGLG